MISVIEGTRDTTLVGLFLIVILVPFESIKLTGNETAGATLQRRVKTTTKHNHSNFLHLENTLVIIFYPFLCGLQFYL
jgi:hypothetical protein